MPPNFLLAKLTKIGGHPAQFQVGQRYWCDIYKYYTAYKLMLDLEETQKKAREAVKRPG